MLAVFILIMNKAKKMILDFRRTKKKPNTLSILGEGVEVVFPPAQDQTGVGFCVVGALFYVTPPLLHVVDE